MREATHGLRQSARVDTEEAGIGPVGQSNHGQGTLTGQDMFAKRSQLGFIFHVARLTLHRNRSVFKRQILHPRTKKTRWRDHDWCIGQFSA